jgi:hypothetical protein
LLTEDETLVDAAGVTVPAELLEPGTDHRFEVLAVADNANRTIHEGTFSAMRWRARYGSWSDRY